MFNKYHPNQPAQAIPLQPKAAHAYRAIWRQIRDLGWDVIPLRGRDGPFRGWPQQPNDDDSIGRWTGKTTGIRMYHSSAFVIDLDVRTDRVREVLLAALSKRWPEFMAGCLRRTSGSTTLALIGQAATAQHRQWTARFKSGSDKPHLVEFFTRTDKRYVGVHGYHSEGREYGYIGKSILDTRLDSLPWFDAGEIPIMLDLCERTMLDAGLEKIAVAGQHHLPGERIYDLKPDDTMTLSDGTRITLAELEQIAGTRKIKGFATIWDPQSKTPDRVLVNRGGAGLTLWDTKTSVSHRWKTMSPAEDPELQRQLRLLAAEIKHPWEK